MMEAEIRTIVCGHVFRGERNVELIVLDEIGELQMTCGKYDHPVDFSDFEVVGAAHVLKSMENPPDLSCLIVGTILEYDEMRRQWLISKLD